MKTKRLIATTSYEEGDLFSQRVTDSQASYQFAHSKREDWDIENPNANPPSGYIGSRRTSLERIFFYETDTYVSLIYIATSRSRAYTYIASNSMRLVNGYADRIKKIFRPMDRELEGVIPVKFWALGHRGPSDTNRKIEVPQWDDIKDNYPEVALEKLRHLMDGFQPSRGGQLLLWHGEPGTGKTFALRAMINQWRTWCTAEYVVDPEKFFQSDASYMMDVLLKDSNSRHEFWEIGDDPDDDDGKWRLLIFEDTGELLASDAKERSGQGLSRLLNVVDGLIGQGLKVLILITTNEEIDSLHPAVSRPGRAALKVPFEALDAAEAVLWASRHGFEVDGDSGLTLAELYAKMDHFVEGGEPREKRKIGFAIDNSPRV